MLWDFQLKNCIPTSKNLLMSNLMIFFPVIFLILTLTSNIFLFENPMNGANQIALLVSSLIAYLIAKKNKISTHDIFNGVRMSIYSAISPILILLIIGGLTSSWIISGIVPAMVYYGIEIINPKFFLITSCLICSLVSLCTGSSWTTAATIGVALVGIGNLIGINPGITAGSIISGAYFGDKMSPLSETTNLAPSVSGSNLIEHIKYMSITTIPSIVITLLIFFVIGLNSKSLELSNSEIFSFTNAIENKFYLGIELFILPLIIAIMIFKKIPAKTTLSIGILGGLIFAIIFQKQLIFEMMDLKNKNILTILVESVISGTEIKTENDSVNDLLTKSGVIGMSWIVFLVISAMVFGGVMHSGGFLKKMTKFLLSKKPTNFEIVRTNCATCLFFNITACDQYLAIVVPGRMFKEIYEENNLHNTNLSRTIEDSGTVTSVLVPWNSCAAYHSEMLAINTINYLPFCFFNLLSPMMTLLFSYYKIKIKKIIDENQ